MRSQKGAIILLLLPACIAWLRSDGSADDYPAIFSSDYRNALAAVEREKWLAPMLQGCGIDPAWAVAIVFPELIRYSRLLDSIQTRSLEVLYVQYGRRYADFSIGRFQLKPSFAEQLEADAGKLLSAEERMRLFPAPACPTPVAERVERLKRLKDLRWNARYLVLFIAVMEKRYGVISPRFRGDEEKLVFFATAYNLGYTRGEEAIRREIGRRHFHVELLRPQRRYSYADIALDYYRRAKKTRS